MKKSLTILFQIIVILIGISTFAFMLWEPQVEGRNVHSTLFEIYFNDPFLAYAFVASIPFFTLLYQTFMLLGYIGQNKLFSPSSMRALRIIKYCAITLIGFLVAAEAYLFIVMRSKDDIAGGVAMGLFLIIISSLIATVASVFESRLRKAF